jgi:hypothetical protein
MPIYITLIVIDLMRGHHVGLMRHNDRLSVGAVHKNNRPRDDVADLANHQAAATAELAAYYALGCKSWNDYTDARLAKAPDLDGFIDVKLRRRLNDHLIVQHDDNSDWAYLSVLADPDGRTFMLDRWCWGRDIMRSWLSKSLAPGRPAYCAQMAEPFMRDAISLRERVRQR